MPPKAPASTTPRELKPFPPQPLRYCDPRTTPTSLAKLHRSNAKDSATQSVADIAEQIDKVEEHVENLRPYAGQLHLSHGLPPQDDLGGTAAEWAARLAFIEGVKETTEELTSTIQELRVQIAKLAKSVKELSQ